MISDENNQSTTVIIFETFSRIHLNDKVRPCCLNGYNIQKSTKESNACIVQHKFISQHFYMALHQLYQLYLISTNLGMDI